MGYSGGANVRHESHSVISDSLRTHLQCRRYKRHKFETRVGKIPWRMAWPPTPLFLPGESHGQRSLADYSPWGCKESDMTDLGAAVLCCPVSFSESMDCSLAGSSVHGILPARILEWVAMPSSRGSSWLGDWTHVSCISCISRWILYHCNTWEAPYIWYCCLNLNIDNPGASGSFVFMAWYTS